MKKILLLIVLISCMLQLFSQGLEDIIVEKIPVTAAAVAADPNLAGATAYRVFVDMAPGYEMQAVFGKLTNELFLSTTTEFYNHPDGVTNGRQLPNFLFNDPAGRFDSYIAIDGVTSSRVGILVSEDSDGTADGYTSGTSLSVQSIGAEFDVPFGSAEYAGKFSVTDGLYYVNGGEKGTTANNRVLIGQFTTDGIFTFEINIQIRPELVGDPQVYVAKNPTGLDLMFPKLTYSSAGGVAPTISITSPANGTAVEADKSLAIAANAGDTDGTVSLVEFLVDGNKVGEDASSPFQYNWMATAGSHQLTAVATDNSGMQATSAAVNITATVPAPPTVSVTSPLNGASYTAGSQVEITANANDPDGTVSRVEFFINGSSIGEDLTAPYQVTWTAVAGTVQIMAVATDNSNLTGTSAVVSITVTNQGGGPPVVSITTPGNGAKILNGSQVNIEANASDAGGSITMVEFLVNGAKVGEDASSPYQYTWTANKNGLINLAARAIDNEGNQTVSSLVAIQVSSGFAPSVVITSPGSGASFTAGSSVTFTATATDADGTITRVDFLVNGIKVGEDLSAPYAYIWTAVTGESEITAEATDNQNRTGISDPVNIIVTDGSGTPPSVSLTSPVNGATYTAGNAVQISATAADTDGNVTLVEFFRNGTKIGEDMSEPYQLTWMSQAGIANLAARATDNSGKQTTSSLVSITVNSSTNGGDTLVFDFSTAIISGNHYQLPVSIISGNTITSLSFGMVINTASIAFDKVINHTSYLVNSSGFDPVTSRLTIQSTSQQPIEKNKALISVSFSLVTGAITPSDLTQFEAKMNNQPCAVKIILASPPVIPPSIGLTSPAADATYNAGTVVSLAAMASDADGSVSLVEFFVNGSKIGEDAISPYQMNWTATAGKADLMARATDNRGNQTNSAIVTITITGGDNVLPTVNLTSPLAGSEYTAGNTVTISATATDTDGTISMVEFFVNDVKIGKDAVAPYQLNWVAVAGDITIKAIATDNKGGLSAASAANIAVNALPAVVIILPSGGEEIAAGQVISIKADATDKDGNIVLVEFFINGVKVGQDESHPYQHNWIGISGQARMTAMVTDAKGAKTTSEPVIINVNALPVVDIVMPVEGERIKAGMVVGIEALATDADGTIARVEFFINGMKAGESNASPYKLSWTAIAGKAIITAVATDNKGAKETSLPVTVEVFSPYELGSATLPCKENSFMVPLQVLDPVADVIGFDLEMRFNPAKVKPTGTITLGNELIAANYADVAAFTDQEMGIINLSVFLKSSAPEGASFKGTGKLLSVEFTKTAAFDPIDTVTFNVSSLTESYFTGIANREVKPGQWIAYKDYTFTGTLVFWSDNSPIAYNKTNPGQNLVTDIMAADPATCDALPGYTVHPDGSGKFKFDTRKGQHISIVRDILATSEVQAAVNGMDAQLTMKVALGDKSFLPSAYQMIAMDVNMDGIISSGDVSQLNQRSIMMIKEFKQAWNYNNQGVKIIDKPSNDWLFVNAITAQTDAGYKISSNYPKPDGTGFEKLNVPVLPGCHAITVSDYEQCPLINAETFAGIMLGDVNGNYGSVPADGRLKSTQATDGLIVFDMSNAIQEQDTIEIPVYATSSQSFKAMDFQLRFDPEKMKFDSIINHTGYMEPTYFYNEEDSTLRFTSYSLLNYEINEKLISIKFNLLDRDIYKTDFYNVRTWLNGDSVGYQITSFTPSTVSGIVNEPEVIVFPNPAQHYFYIKTNENAEVDIVDLSGRLVFSRTELLAGQAKEFNVEDLMDGIYIVRINNSKYPVQRKLVIKR